jgi:hypothetical protein
MYRAKTALDSYKTRTSPRPSAKVETSPQVNEALPLTITSPADNSVVDTAQIELSGTTIPNTYITILTEKNEYIIVPSELGDFSQTISLVKGANTIDVTVYTPTGDKTEAKLSVVYTTVEL